MTAEGKGDRVQGVFPIAGREDVGKSVGDEGQLEVAVPQQHRVYVEVDRVLPDPRYAYHLQEHYECHYLVVALPVGNHQLEYQQHHRQQDEDDSLDAQVDALAEHLVVALLEDGVGKREAGGGRLVEQAISTDQGVGREVHHH